MPRTVSASEAKNELGGIMAWAQKNKDDVIIENRGQPNAVLVSFEEYQKILKLREDARRRELLSQIRQLRQEVQDRNQDLGKKEAIALADRFSREMVEDMVKEGKIRYEGQ